MNEKEFELTFALRKFGVRRQVTRHTERIIVLNKRNKGKYLQKNEHGVPDEDMISHLLDGFFYFLCVVLCIKDSYMDVKYEKTI